MLTIEEKQFRAQLIHELKRLSTTLESIGDKMDDLGDKVETLSKRIDEARWAH